MIRIAVGDGVQYAIGESGTGTPVLLLHGFTGSGTGAATWLPGLSRIHRVIAVDLLGHGSSDSPPAGRHAVERQAADVAAILHRLAASPADVLGYSFGARIALRLAVDVPASVRSLVLESPSAGIADPAARTARREADGRWVAQLERGDMVGFVRDWAAQPIFASQRRLPEPVRERLAAERAANRPEGLAASLVGAGQGVMTPLHEWLSRIGVPTLVISGGLDQRGGERATEVAAGIPGAIHESIEDAGHTPHLETPGRFGDLVMSFLASPFATSIPTPAS
jgi:2-succinyl-6-hydroxy-2,4-cyclohexadiene-1-carboxylate synthase